MTHTKEKCLRNLLAVFWQWSLFSSSSLWDSKCFSSFHWSLLSSIEKRKTIDCIECTFQSQDVSQVNYFVSIPTIQNDISLFIRGDSFFKEESYWLKKIV